MKRVCVFCGSSEGVRPEYRAAAEQVGALLAQRGIELVYGGGKVGLMGAVADAALTAGGRVIGIIPQGLVDREVSHQGLTELRVVASMHERKALMADLAEGFLCLPGGYGTWDEFCEILTWAQLGLHRHACGLLNVAGYYDPLLAMADRAREEGFVREEYRRLMLADADAERLLDRMEEYVSPVAGRWGIQVER
ncbi:MAG TPA: TIGR00730 family Rossman fold protein [Acidobacteriaceae bacterium]|nr:TIGR00730 family Rossman fold protein [Acidobacteriaceae bacterium]